MAWPSNKISFFFFKSKIPSKNSLFTIGNIKDLTAIRENWLGRQIKFHFFFISLKYLQKNFLFTIGNIKDLTAMREKSAWPSNKFTGIF